MNIRYFKHLIPAALLLLTVSCSDKEEPEQTVVDDSEYAASASISSSNSAFTATGGGGQIRFATEGGKVVVNVDCGSSWGADNSASDLFTISANVGAGTLTVTAGQNLQTEDVSATITVYTAVSHTVFATLTVTQEAYDAPSLSVGTDAVHLPAAGELSAEFEVDSSLGDFDVDCSASWLTVGKTETGVSVVAEPNEDEQERTAEVTVSSSDGYTVGTDVVTVVQDGKAYITFSKSQSTFYEEAGASSVTVSSNYDWDFSYDSSAGWLTAERDGDTVTITVTAFDDESGREGVLTFTAGDGAANVAEETYAVVQKGPQADELILIYNVTGSPLKIQLPVAGTLDCTVDWGDDGEIETVTSANPTHYYASEGKYEVRVAGSVSTLDGSIYGERAADTKLIEVRQWGSLGLTSMSSAFYACKALEKIPETTDGVFKDVTSFYHTFFGCNVLASIPSDIFEGCTKITDFEGTFGGCWAVTEIPAGLFADCSAAKNFDSTFYGCSGITSVPAGLFTDKPNLTNMTATFYGTGLTSVPDGLIVNCPNITTFQWFLGWCQSIESIPDGLFSGYSKVTDFSYVMYYCYSLKEVPADTFAGCTNVRSFSNALAYCESLTTVPEDLFADCTLVTNFSGVFYYCDWITSIPEGIFSHCPSVTTFEQAFAYCYELLELPAGLFANNSKVTNFNGTFGYCAKLTSLPEGLFSACTAVTDFGQSFCVCVSLASLPKGLFSGMSTVTDFSLAFYWDLALTELPENMFAGCTGVKTFESTFQACTGLKTVPTDIFSDCKAATTFTLAFSACSAWEGESPYAEASDGTHVHLYERSSHRTDMGYTSPTAYSNCFAYCTSLSDYLYIPTTWGGLATTSSLSTSDAPASLTMRKDGPVTFAQLHPDSAAAKLGL